jgi:acyl-CoA reductase-like NAD-dependent aldehyde dehydrogenase
LWAWSFRGTAIFNASAELAPALAAGCSSVVKPAEATLLSARVLDRIIAEAGVPDVEQVAFTGSTEVGKEIVRASAGNLKKVMLELGGKSPVLIYDDAELDKPS